MNEETAPYVTTVTLDAGKVYRNVRMVWDAMTEGYTVTHTGPRITDNGTAMEAGQAWARKMGIEYR